MQPEVTSDQKLWQELKHTIDGELARRGGSHFANHSVLVKVVSILALIIGCYFALWSVAPSAGWLCLWGILGIASFFLIVNCAHDASHGRLTRFPVLNSSLLLISFGLLGIDGQLWSLRHLSAHHPHTNIVDQDPDSVANPFLRLSPHHPWHPWFRFQHLYAPLLYALAFLHTAFFQDFEHLIAKPLPYLQRIRSHRVAIMRMASVKIGYLSLFLLLPWLTADIPLPWLVLGLFTQQVAASLVFVSTICLNHYVMETTFYPKDAKNVEGHHLRHQLLASADWYPTSRFWCAVMGGANAHTAHHLFPGLSHRHYHWVSEIIQEFCDRHALPYNSFSFAEGLSSHFCFLRTLGKSKHTEVK
jgi:linoleoyl-CoA desaturase